MGRPQKLHYRLLTAHDLARTFSVSTDSVYYWARIGVLKCLRIGGSVRFQPEEVARLFRAGQVKE